MTDAIDFDDEPTAVPTPPPELIERQEELERPARPAHRTREIPHSAEAEEQVLAACLLEGSDVLPRAIADGVTESSFYSAPNRYLFSVCLNLHAQGQPATLETVAQEAMKEGKIDAIGGFGYLMQVTAKAPTTAHAGYFITALRDKQLLRDLIKASTMAVERAYEPSADPDAILKDSTERLARIQSSFSADSALDECEYRDDRELPKPPTIFSIKGTQVCTPGNLTTLYSQAKVGKTALIGGFIASTLAPEGSVYDTLGVSGSNTSGHAVLHFDTEQSAYDRQQMLTTAKRRVRQTETPAWLKSYLLTGKSAAECRRLVEKAIRLNSKKFGGIHSILLDGVGDLVNNPNDEDECFPLITRLHGLAIEFNCPIINVLHLNPSSETKGRGHLGSQLERKSESNLMLEKGESGVTKLYATKQRGKMISKSDAQCYAWSDDQKMHVTVESAGDEDAPKGKPGRREMHPFSTYRSVIPLKSEPAMPLKQIGSRCGTNLPISTKQLYNLLQRYAEQGHVEIIEEHGNPKRYRQTI